MQIVRVLAFATAFACVDGVAQTTVAGHTPGVFRVTETGAGEYRIPIQVPPGIAGMEPKLALVYNSHGGNGFLGVGWSLAGLSAIVRCPASVAQDGYQGGVKFDYADRYCLDGQRLVAISGNYGNYGDNGTEFRTERESYTKVLAYGNAGNGPAYFKAWTKSGQILEFGNTADSRIEATGRSTARVWALNRISDTKGNYLTVEYSEDSSNGDFYPLWIRYTGNAAAGTATSASVQFVYATKPDAVPRYITGSVVKTTLQLSNLKTFAGAALIRDYRLAYQSSGGTYRSLLTSVTECETDAPTSACLPATSVAWRPGTGGWGGSTAYPLPAQVSNQGQDGGVRLIDLNGDGLVDCVWSASWTGGWNPSGAWINTGNGWNSASSFTLPVTITIDGKDNGVRFVDLNGDGLPDVVQYAYWAGWTTFAGAWLNTGNGWAYAPQFTPGGQITIDGKDNGVRFVDLNGDGKVDHVQNGYWNTGPWNPNGAWLNNGNGWSWAPQYTPAQTTIDGLDGGVRFVELNGDGLIDMVWSGSWPGPWNPNQAWLNNGNGWTHSPNHTLPVPITVNGQDGGVRLVDLNGDGLADIVQNGYWSSGPWNPNSAWINNGDSWIYAPQYIPAQIALDYQDGGVRFVDLNGDGLVDMVWSANWPGPWIPNYAWLNNGNGWTSVPGFNMPVAITSHGYDNGVRLEDVNGDGLADVMLSVNWGVWNYGTWTNTGLVSDFVATVTNGLAASIVVTYSPLTVSSVHTKDTGAVHPVMDVQFPLHVVSSVSQSNAIGGTSDATYKYWGAKARVQGGGFLGFRKIEASDSGTGIKSVTTFRQDYPYIGIVSLAEKAQASGAVIHRVTNIWTDNPAYNALPYTYTTGKYHRSDLTQGVEQSYELSGGLVTTVTTTSAFDAHGNAIQVTVGTGDGYSKATTNTYNNETTNWFLGRLLRSTVQSTTP